MNVSKISHKGTITLINMQSDLRKNDYKEISEISKSIEKEPYNITMKKGDFGAFYTIVAHENGNKVEFKSLSFPTYKVSIAEYINNLVKLIHIGKEELL